MAPFLCPFSSEPIDENWQPWESQVAFNASWEKSAFINELSKMITVKKILPWANYLLDVDSILSHATYRDRTCKMPYKVRGLPIDT